MSAVPMSSVVRTAFTIPPRPRRIAFMALLCAAQLAGCGGGGAGAGHAMPAQETAAAPALPPSLWRADGLALTTPAEARPVDPSARWSAERYASRDQLAFEEVTAAPYTVVLHADDEAAIETALAAAALLRDYSPDAARLGLFVRSRQPALAARLAERLTREQGWLNVFVVT